MGNLTIPDNHIKPLVELLSLSDDNIDRFLSSLSRVKLSIHYDKLAKSIAPHLAEIAAGQREAVADALVSLYATYATRAPSAVDISEFVDDVLEALVEREPTAVSSGERDQAARRLMKLLSFERLTTATKAMQVLSDQERLFFSARVLTDARPVYGADPSAEPVGIVINHTLRITYLQDNNTIDFYVAVDSQDLSTLKEILGRAQEKAESLKKVFSSAKISVIEP